MADSIESYLIFEDYSITNMHYERNFDYDEDKEIELDYNFQAFAKFSENKDKAKTTITCTIFEDDFKQQEAPFFLEIGITGFFKCEGDLDIEGFQMNSMAILLPYLRSIVTSFTAQSGISPVILPTINVYNAFKEKKDI